MRRRLGGIDAIVIVALFGLTGFLYTRASSFEFVNFDDDQYVFENPQVRNGLTWQGARWAFTTGHASNWHPLTWLSHMLDVELFGVTPGGPHIVNSVLHAVNAALLFIALLRLSGDRWPAAACAVLFVIHPLRVESVAWVSERKDLLSGLFWMATLIAYERYARAPTPARYATTITMLVLGLLSKPMVVTLPFALLLLDYWPLNRLRSRAGLRQRVVEKVPMFVIVAGASVVTYLVQAAGRSVAQSATLGWQARFFNAIVSYAQYVRDTFWPHNLAVFYPHPYSIPGGSISWPALTAAAAVLVAISLVSVAWIRRMPWLFVGWCWFLGTLVPVIGLVQVGSQSHADRYTYIPAIGLSIAVAWTVRRMVAGRRGAVAAVTVAGAAAAAVLCVLTWRQVGTWRDSQTLMRHAIAAVPNNYAAWNNLGHDLDRQGEHAAAEAAYRKVLEINPTDAIALNNVAVKLNARGAREEARALYRQAIQRDPTYAPAYVQLGNIYAREGRSADAVMLYEQAIRRDPNLAEAYHNLALVQAEHSDLKAAILHWHKALDLNPDYADALHAYGVALVMAGQPQEGVASLERALQIEPGRVDSLTRLAWILATHPRADVRRPLEAVDLAQRAAQVQPEDPTILDTVAAALAQAGRWEEALAAAERAVSAARAADETELATAITQRLSLYRSKTAYVQGQR